MYQKRIMREILSPDGVEDVTYQRGVLLRFWQVSLHSLSILFFIFYFLFFIVFIHIQF